MRNHLKIIRMLYSPSLITEILLIIEVILAVQLVALSTNSLSYQRLQIKTADSCWKDGKYLYYTALPSAQELLDPQAVVDRYAEVEEVYLGAAETRGIVSDELRDFSHQGQIALIRCNSSMLDKMASRLEIHTEIDPGETVAVCVPLDVAKVFPLGTEIILPDDNWEETPHTVCGIINEDELPITATSGSFKTVESLTVNCREQRERENNIVFVSINEKQVPFTAGMFRLSENADAEKLADELSGEYVNCGEFCPYTAMRNFSEESMISGDPTFLLQAVLLVLVFVSHFIGYLFLSTRNKERTNALLSINGATPAKLSVYNIVSVLLLVFPALLLGAAIVPLTEKRSNFPAFGGHFVMWECMGFLAAVLLFMICFAARGRVKKGNTILLYRKGT